MINFHRIQTEDRAAYEQIHMNCPTRGCEYTFANLFLWGRQEIAMLHGCIAFFTHFNGRSVYPYPIGSGDRKAVLEALLEDAAERGIPFRIGGMTPEDREELERLFPGRFFCREDRDLFDYVYAIDDLADLRGRKLQRKRNHLNRFRAVNPDYTVEPISPENLEAARELVEDWYVHRLETTGGDYMLEQIAMDRAFSRYEELKMDGLILRLDGRPVAMTMGSPLSPDTLDVHFEKALEDVDGAYAAINSEFARYIRLKYPEIRYLDREDDMGLEGLRKAKLSYQPHHMAEKYRAYLKEDVDDL